MRTLNYLIIALALAGSPACGPSSSGQENGNEDPATAHEHNEAAPEKSKPKKKPLSPKKEAMAMVGKNHIHIDYSSPSVRGRVIWGGLVPYGQVWSTGAHKATAITFGRDVVINSTEVPAGKYGFFTIPGEETWVLILNKNWDQHLADEYDPADDILRLEVTPEKTDSLQEALEYRVEALNDSTARISVAWEHIRLSFDVKNK